jgi:hypothetical protein
LTCLYHLPPTFVGGLVRNYKKYRLSPGGSADDDPVPLVVGEALCRVVLDVDWPVAEIQGVLQY